MLQVMPCLPLQPNSAQPLNLAHRDANQIAQHIHLASHANQQTPSKSNSTAAKHAKCGKRNIED